MWSWRRCRQLFNKLTEQKGETRRYTLCKGNVSTIDVRTQRTRAEGCNYYVGK